MVLVSRAGFSLWLLENHRLSIPLSKSVERSICIRALFRLLLFLGETIPYEAFRGKRANEKDHENCKYGDVPLVTKKKLSLM